MGGFSTYGIAIQGVGDNSTQAAVYGYIGNSHTPPDPPTNGVGVEGISNRGYGVEGISSLAPGVYGESSASGAAGVYGKADSTGDGGHFTTGGIGASGAFGENTSGNSSANGLYGKITTGGTDGGPGNAIWGENPHGSGGYAGWFHGDVNVTGTLTCGTGCSSDETLKKNIAPLSGTDALTKLLELKGVTFEWRDPKEHQDRSGLQRGVIAQQVQTVFPEWVHKIPGEGTLTVDPDARSVLGMTVEGFRTLKFENDALKAKNAAVEARLSNLENGSHPIAASFTSGLGISPGNLGISLVTLFGAFVMSRKKKDQKSA